MRPVWTDFVLSILVFILTVVGATAKEEFLELLAVGGALGGLLFATCRLMLKGVTEEEFFTSLVFPAVLLMLLSALHLAGAPGGFLAHAGPPLAFFMLVCTPVTIIALRRAALRGGFRYLYAVTAAPFFMVSVIGITIWITGSFPAYTTRLAHESSGEIYIIPLLALILASGLIWYWLLRWIELIFRKPKPMSEQLGVKR